MPQLSDEDRRAVDVLLMNGQPNSNATPPVASADAGAGARINQVARMLQLLDAMPAPEPSPDLAQRTLARIRSSTPTGHSPGDDRPAATDPGIV